MEIKQITALGMVMDKCSYESCTAEVGVGEDFATIYYIESKDKNKGHATELINRMRIHYETQGKEFATSVALSPQMKHLVKKLNLKEYDC